MEIKSRKQPNNFGLQLMLKLLLVLTTFMSFAHAQVLGQPSSFVTPSAKFDSAVTCSGCHNEQYEQWRSSMMSYSSISPPIHALELTENHVSRVPTSDPSVADLFGFGRLSRTTSAPTNGQSYTENRLFCQKCHSPVAVFTDLFSLYKDFDFSEENRGDFPDSHSLLRQIIVNDPNFDSSLYRNGFMSPSNLQIENAKTAVEGVTCTVCHRMTGQDDSEFTTANTATEFFGLRPFLPGDEGVANSAYHIARGTENNQMNYGPYRLDGTPLGIGNPEGAPLPLAEAAFRPHGAGLSTVSTNIPGKVGELIRGTDGVDRPYMSTSLMCGSCHDVRIPFADAESGEPFRRVENLFTEWKTSPWNNNNHPYIDGSPTPSPFTNPSTLNENNVKSVTTCQDCHMSTFMTNANALPKEYEQGPISALTPDNIRRKTNHRFVGVDRFLMHDVPTVNDQNTGDLLEFDIAQIESTAMGASRFSDLHESSLDFKDGKADLREVLLKKAVAFKLESAKVDEVANELNIEISVENIGAGHNVPAGLSQERQVWIELEVLDGQDRNVYTSGYLTPLENLNELFDPTGETRYMYSHCGKDDGHLEYECDLDEFRVSLDPALRIVGSLVDGDDKNLRKDIASGPSNLGLINYQNGFRRNGEKVLTQFIGDSIDNSNALKPFERRVERYDVSLDGHQGPFTVNTRLRFRPLPHEFLAALKESSSTSRVTDDVIKLNKVIEMEEDSCVANVNDNDLRRRNVRSCNSVEPLASGFFSRCAVYGDHIQRKSGTETPPGKNVLCYGSNKNYRLPLELSNDNVLVPTVATALTNVQSIALGGTNGGCALHYNGTVSCWGDGNNGMLGDGNPNPHIETSPLVIAGLADVRQIAAGSSFTCAISGDDEISCWGYGFAGQLGDGILSSHVNATPLSFTAENVESIAASNGAACYIGAHETTGEPGRVYCWGSAKVNGFSNAEATPTPVPLDRQARKVGVGARFSCALLNMGEVACWGSNTLGELGIGDTNIITESLEPVSPLLGVRLGEASRVRALDISVGSYHACALMSDKTVECWGWGYSGEVGNGQSGNSNTSFLPTTVLTSVGMPLVDVRYINAGNGTSCAITETDETWCWGGNSNGQLGLGDTVSRSFATKIPSKESAPYKQDFSAGLPGGSWYYYTSNKDFGRTEVVNGKLRMDVNESGTLVLNEAILRVDLSNAQSAVLNFFQSDHGDESHAMPESFDGHHNSDGVAVSNDGYVWYRLLPSADLEVTSSGEIYSIDLEQFAANIRSTRNPGFYLTENFQIKFQQYDNFEFPTDGREWDNISVATLPLEQNFDAGLPRAEDGWEFYSSNSFGRIAVESGKLQMDVTTDGNFSLNEAIYTADLYGMTSVLLEFTQGELNDERHAMPEYFVGHSNSDGVAISVDGNTWYRIVSEVELDVGSTGTYFSVDLASEIARIRNDFDDEFGYSSTFKIKFQQYDNYTFGTDGRTWDDFSLSH